MPIVFEEVTGEIVPERGPAQAEAGGESPPADKDSVKRCDARFT